MRRIRSLPASPGVFLLALAAIAAIVYLSRVRDLSLYDDEWAFVYDAHVAGPGLFRDMFQIDRPARGLFLETYYLLFGPLALPYHLAAFGWRMIAVAAAFWLLRLLWPGNDRRAFLIAVIFALWPGYLKWVSAIEYQPIMASLALQGISVATTVKAVQSERSMPRVLWLVAAILTGWAYLLLVEYAIGMEIFRFLCVYLVLRRRRLASHIRQFAAGAWRTAWFALLVPAGFLLWRLLIFTNERAATDVGIQFGSLIGDPLGTLPRWIVNWAHSALNVGIFAWTGPFSETFYALRLRDVALGVASAAAIVAIIGVVGILSRGATAAESRDALDEKEFAAEALSIGIVGIVFGVLPVVMANRSVTFDLSHYGLPASLAAVLVAAGLLASITPRALQAAIYLLLVGLAATTHYAVQVGAIREERAIERFWWQVAWRAPGIRARTTLVINYPWPGIDKDGDGVQQAPNLLYFPDAQVDEAGIVRYALSGVAPSDQAVRLVLLGALLPERGRRTHAVQVDYGNVLILSQPGESSCVHVIDGSRPILSAGESGNVVLIAERSRIQNVETAAEPAVPAPFAFGPAPAHDWCYYFETADLAVQRGDWARAAALGNEAVASGLSPEDQVEWTPFLEAYVRLNDMEQVRRLSTLIGIDAFVRAQSCRNLTSIQAYRAVTSVEMQELVDQRLCRNVR